MSNPTTKDPDLPDLTAPPEPSAASLNAPEATPHGETAPPPLKPEDTVPEDNGHEDEDEEDDDDEEDEEEEKPAAHRVHRPAKPAPKHKRAKHK